MSESTAERLTGVPDFAIGGATFSCFTVGEGGGSVLVWRSACKRIAVGSIIVDRQVKIDGELVWRKAKDWWARLDGRLLGKDFPAPRAAMLFAAQELSERREVAA